MLPAPKEIKIGLNGSYLNQYHDHILVFQFFHSSNFANRVSSVKIGLLLCIR
jgi:hypothetical protein